MLCGFLLQDLDGYVHVHGIFIFILGFQHIFHIMFADQFANGSVKITWGSVSQDIDIYGVAGEILWSGMRTYLGKRYI